MRENTGVKGSGPGGMTPLKHPKIASSAMSRTDQLHDSERSSMTVALPESLHSRGLSRLVGRDTGAVFTRVKKG